MDALSFLFAIAMLVVGVGAGLAIGFGAGSRKAAAAAQQATLDADRAKEISQAALADALGRLAEINNQQQEQARKQANDDAARQEKTVLDLVNPIDQKLKQLTETLQLIEQSRVADSTELKQNLLGLGQLTDRLQIETHKLASAMTDNKARGSWGELQLKRVVELAGMMQHCDFVTQETITADGGRLRPDLIVKLPQSRAIVVDAKVPMSAYLNSVSSQTEEERRSYAKQHARDVLTHVNELAKRNYTDYVSDALDFVVMFVPGDPFLTAAFEAQPSLFEDAIEKGVFMASPGSLIALLRAISFGWRQEQLAEHAKDIAKVGEELHARVATFSGHFKKIGESLKRANERYNDAVGSLERSVMPSIRKLEEKGVKSSKAIDDPDQLDVTTRQLSLGTDDSL
ncbi:MAG: hypothetical protein RLZZ31_1610 [Actinomycetota bacterium]